MFGLKIYLQFKTVPLIYVTLTIFWIPGTYMPYGRNITANVTDGVAAGYQSDCLPCTMGYYCLNATINPYPCGKGKYSETSQSLCQTCPAGRYCDLEATGVNELHARKSCPAGKYCKGGLKDVSEATSCSKAHYCPNGKHLFLFHPQSNTKIYQNCDAAYRLC